MTYVYLNLAALALLVGFGVLTRIERSKGVRILEAVRTDLDTRIAKIEFVIAHVDWNSYARAEIGRVLHRIGHDIAHLSLQGVRSAERSLTEVVRTLRTKRTPELATREPVRPFVKTLSDFKGHLEATRPQMPEIL